MTGATLSAFPHPSTQTPHHRPRRSACICFAVLSHLLSVLLAAFICDSLSVFHSVSATPSLCLTPPPAPQIPSPSPRCHRSPAPCLSVILRLIAIDHRGSHMSTNLIKSDKRWYFYRRICKQTPAGPTRARQKKKKKLNSKFKKITMHRHAQ